jgi:rubrerythrin
MIITVIIARILRGIIGHLTPENEQERKLFFLQIVQPGLAGLMDGSVSTLAPIFAAAFAAAAASAVRTSVFHCVS